jgi:hypothetical protein
VAIDVYFETLFCARGTKHSLHTGAHHFARGAALLARSQGLLACGSDKSMRFGVAYKAASSSDVKTKGAEFLLHLAKRNGRHFLLPHLACYFGAQLIQNSIPAIATAEPPTHGGIGWMSMTAVESRTRTVDFVRRVCARRYFMFYR